MEWLGSKKTEPDVGNAAYIGRMVGTVMSATYVGGLSKPQTMVEDTAHWSQVTLAPISGRETNSLFSILILD